MQKFYFYTSANFHLHNILLATTDRFAPYLVNVAALYVWFWFDFCFTTLQHILGHFGRGQLP